MQKAFIHYYSRSNVTNSGQALIWVLVLLGVSTLAISALCKIALWKLDSSIAIMNQRTLIESWEAKRGSLIKSSYPTSSFKRININNNQLGIPIISSKDIQLDSLRIPIFHLGDTERPSFNWPTFLKGPRGSCLRVENELCKEFLLDEGKSLIIGDLVIDKLTLKTGLSLIIATGDISIGSLQLEPGATGEFLSGFNLTVADIVKSPGSSIFFYSSHGEIRLTNLSESNCLSSPIVRASSKFPIQLKTAATSAFGCQSLALSQFWQDLRYLGDLSQKSLK